MIDDNPPEGFLRIDFDRGRPDPTFNTHIGALYAKRGGANWRASVSGAFPTVPHGMGAADDSRPGSSLGAEHFHTTVQ